MIRALLAPLKRFLENRVQEASRTSASTKVALRALYLQHRDMIGRGAAPRLADTGLRVFSQFEEDGKLLFIFAALGVSRGTFLDIGAADGVVSNCANLALNFGWNGVFIDADATKVRRGRAFYGRHADTWLSPPTLVHALVRPESCNAVVQAAGLAGEIDLLSIDIDGDDYWIWEALTVVTPKVVIIEARVELGLQESVSPLSTKAPRSDLMVAEGGASPASMTKLAERKGYRLVGANDQGFNLIYVRKDLALDLLPEVGLASLLGPRPDGIRS